MTLLGTVNIFQGWNFVSIIINYDIAFYQNSAFPLLYCILPSKEALYRVFMVILSYNNIIPCTFWRFSYDFEMSIIINAQEIFLEPNIRLCFSTWSKAYSKLFSVEDRPNYDYPKDISFRNGIHQLLSLAFHPSG